MIDQRRRQVLAGLGALALVGPAAATPEEMAAAINAFTGGAAPKVGRVTLEVATLVDNGNTVPVAVRVDSPMTAADHVAAIAIFNERNPETGVAVFTLGPRAGRAQVSTRIRMATSQKLVALARMSDGSCWMHSADVVVALAACIEGEA
ncbi:SoxY-related AACIE arm protein [Massilia eurypsychrophila]|jgi:sulfur-oxidizing protein SoxY|uniref:SoxY-related AACIE arm protein n=1 Tax=Massilia eurypsychrophila TaxID=1485217 RepID=A0A2G8TJK0_9BURK|nr:SoxY-related AACIE arm protein [Massilia eurypsychrophila]PIL46225.1 SoxY-related AACIE arm protein [Massilia eurypsychrophila]